MIVLIGASGAALAQTKKERKRAQELKLSGDKAFRARNYRQATSDYGQAILIVPNDPYAHYWKGVAHYNLKENPEALREFEIALSQGFKPIEVYRVRWYLHYEAKEYDAALSDLTKALQIDPDNVVFRKGIGEIFYAQGKYAESLQIFQAVALKEPKDGDVYFNIARAQAGLGHVREQGAAAQAALSNRTRMIGESYFLLADSQQKQGQLEAAIDNYQRAIAAKPENYQAYKNLADIYRSLSDFKAAIEVAKKALLKFPEDGSFYTDVSWYYSLDNEPARAAEAARSATKLLPNQYLGYTNLCRALNDLKDYSGAVAACNTALKLNPGDGETYFYLARAYDFAGRRSEATGYYSKAVTGLEDFVKRNPDYSDGYYLLGNAYLSDNQRDKAIEAYKKVIEMSPKFTRARFNLAMAYLQTKDKASAMEQYSALLPLDAALAARLKGEIDKY
ncbi:MAG: tetratricopeptide repeat protein [Acidobacteria bacterium]|nr:tetratricopeptide repeat protein [Acidobacteriota bacterium]